VAGPAEHTGRPFTLAVRPSIVNCASPSRITNISSTTLWKVMPDARARRNDAAMQKLNSGRQRSAAEQRREGHAAGAAVDRGRLPVRRRVGVRDPLRERAGRGGVLRAGAHQHHARRRTAGWPVSWFDLSHPAAGTASAGAMDGCIAVILPARPAARKNCTVSCVMRNTSLPRL
jgi:hypothetical protein